MLKRKYNNLVDKANQVFHQIDYWQKLYQKASSNSGPKQFTQDELRTLIQLCHPDKHQGKESAVAITQKLLRLRG